MKLCISCIPIDAGIVRSQPILRSKVVQDAKKAESKQLIASL